MFLQLNYSASQHNLNDIYLIFGRKAERLYRHKHVVFFFQSEHVFVCQQVTFHCMQSSFILTEMQINAEYSCS